jgi:hypothetical protein
VSLVFADPYHRYPGGGEGVVEEEANDDNEVPVMVVLQVEEEDVKFLSSSL